MLLAPERVAALLLVSLWTIGVHVRRLRRLVLTSS